MDTMISTLTIYLDQLEAYIQQMRHIVSQLHTCADSQEKIQLTREYQRVWNDSLDTRQMIRLEIQRISPNHPLHERKRQLYAVLKQVKQDFRYASPPDLAANPDFETAEGLMHHGRTLQAESLTSLQQTVSTVHDARDLGVKINVKLAQQTEQIQGYGRKLEDLGQQVRTGSEIGRHMLRQWRHSKAIWLLVTLIVVGIVVIIVLETK